MQKSFSKAVADEEENEFVFSSLCFGFHENLDFVVQDFILFRFEICSPFIYRRGGFDSHLLFDFGLKGVVLLDMG